MTRVACLWLGRQAQHEEGTIIEAAARTLGMNVIFADHSANDFGAAFELIARERPDALLVTPTGPSFANRKLILEFATAHRLPTIYHIREFAEAGGLMSYGTSIKELWRRAAGQVDRILKGAKPSEIPSCVGAPSDPEQRFPLIPSTPIPTDPEQHSD